MGTISNTVTHGITLAVSGTYASPLTITTSGYVNDIADSGDAIFGPNTQAWTVINYGRVRSTGSSGIELQDGGFVSNSSTGTITGSLQGVDISGTSGTVLNAGTIVGTSGAAVLLEAGGSVSNTGGLIEASTGIAAGNLASTVTNTGTILGTTGYAVYLSTGGSVGNTGTAALMKGHSDGVLIIGAAGTVTNSGTISGSTDAGIKLV